MEEPRAPTAWAQARRVLSLAWVPLVASLVSLVLSVGSIVIATRDPSVLMILPDQVRFAQGEGIGYAYAYLQPTFVSTGANDRVEVIRDITLTVRRLDDGESVELAWDEVGTFTFDPADDSLTYEYVSDAAPLLVAPDSAENPLALFQGPEGWLLTPGRYEVDVRATREVAASELEGDFQIELAEEQVAFLNEADGTRFLSIPIDISD
jgi:hypothetical protein